MGETARYRLLITWGLALVLVALGAVSALPAHAVTFGANVNAPAGSNHQGLICGAFCTVRQRESPAGAFVAPIDGVIVRWRVAGSARVHTAAGEKAREVRLRLLRQVGGKAQYVGASATQLLPYGHSTRPASTFDARMRVRAGDEIALDCCQSTNTDDGVATVWSYIDGDQYGTRRYLAELGNSSANGTSYTFNSSWAHYAIAINADVERDGDGDGYGDGSQDSDDDDDGRADREDAFPTDPAEQDDTDDDGTGDNADTDDDGDEVADATDNCRTDPNAGQANADGDARGDACDDDDDNDGRADTEDDFPTDPAEQDDFDGDGTGDHADTDDDGDRVPDATDNCARDANPDQADADDDGRGNACEADDDADGVDDSRDNCPVSANADQANHDTDAAGDACDADDDQDTVADTADNCPLAANGDQANHDGDAAGNACDGDDDQDAVDDGADNCPLAANTDQADLDRDGRGDACDADLDNDTVPNAGDNCPSTANRTQDDADRDGDGDACDGDDDDDAVEDAGDNCRTTPNPDQANHDRDAAGDACDADDDQDAVGDPSDNCPLKANSNQADADGDGDGDACDPDDDNDTVEDAGDNCPTAANPDQADADGDGRGNACDTDADNDGVPDARDNCPDARNADQRNSDADGQGDACDADDDNDGVSDADERGRGTDPTRADTDADGARDDRDNCPVTPNFSQADVDGDGLGDPCDPRDDRPPVDPGGDGTGTGGGTPPPRQGLAPAGPACGSATPQEREYRDGVDDSDLAPDLVLLFVRVAADCTVEITYGLDSNGLLSADSLTLAVDADGDLGTGSKALHGADRFLAVQGPLGDLRAQLGIVDPATDGILALVQPGPAVRAAETRLVVVSTSVEALGLQPGRVGRLHFASMFRAGGTSDADFAPEVNRPGFDLAVDFKPPSAPSAPAAPAGPGSAAQPPPPGPASLTPLEPISRPRLRGRARVGGVLRCAAPKVMTAAGARPRYSWRRSGRAIKGAKRKTLKLRRADAGKRIACRVTATVAGQKAVATSVALRVAKRRR